MSYLYKMEVLIEIFVAYIDETHLMFYDKQGVPHKQSCLCGTFLPHYSLYSNIRSYMQTVSPSLTPISSMRAKTPLSRRMRSKNIRLS